MEVVYAGKRLFNWANLYLVCCVIFAIYWVEQDSAIYFKYGSLALLAWSIYGVTATTFYFVVTEDELIVCNYLRPFGNRRFAFSDIEYMQVKEIRRAYTGYSVWIGRAGVKEKCYISKTMTQDVLGNLVSELRRQGVDVEF